jgi:hypothetical protein
MTKREGCLGRKKEEAIVALLAQRNVDDAARVVGVPTRTLYRWLKEPDFDTAYREARHAAFSQAVARMQQMSAAAVSTLGKIMVDQTAPAASRVRAADCVLERATKAIEIEDLEARLSMLEHSFVASKTDAR